MIGNHKISYSVYTAVCFLLFGLVLFRSYFVPFSHDEVATFYFYIQPGSFIPFYAHPDANGHFLNNVLSWICYKFFGSSPFSLRLPSAAAFLLLCYAVWRWMEHFKSNVARVLFIAGLLLLYPFVAYFSMCRGYALSMACLVMSLFYLFSYIRTNTGRHFVLFLLFMQLALAANLTLLFVAGIATVVTIALQWRRRELWRPRLLLIYLLHAGLLLYWTMFAFFLQENGALYYGAGASYWEVTFRSLITTLFGEHFIFEAIIIFLCVIITLLWLRGVWQRRSAFLWSTFSLAWILTLVLVLSFFLLKRFLGINYPEDRTGLFFYVFFLCVTCLGVDSLQTRWSRFSAALPLAAACVLSWHYFDFRNHPWSNFETMPRYFYDILEKEQQQSDRRITVAGHRIREFIYGFLNYRGSAKLNHMTSPEALQMNCDYALAVKADKPWYDSYYTELATEERWGFRLLKRKTPIERIPLLEFDEAMLIEGDGEYFNCFDIRDTTFASTSPLQAEVTFDALDCPVPLQAWFVLQVDAEDEADNVFVRVPLDLIKGNWQGTDKFSLSLVTGNSPSHIKRMVLYLWNINKQPLKLRITKSVLYRLQADGINVKSQAKL